MKEEMVSIEAISSIHHKANVSLKNLRTVVLTDVEDDMSVWYEIYNTNYMQMMCDK